MSAFQTLHHIFDKPLDTTIPNNSIKPIPDSRSSFLDILSNPHLTEKTDSTNNDYFPTKETKHFQSNINMNAESLLMCTEGLGFESFDDSKNEENSTKKQEVAEILHGDQPKRSRIKEVEFPPPISSIGTSGKQWVCLKSYRTDGRFILKEVRIPTQELLHACREDGRLKLLYHVQSDDESLYEEIEDDEHHNVDFDADYDADQ